MKSAEQWHDEHGTVPISIARQIQADALRWAANIFKDRPPEPVELYISPEAAEFFDAKADQLDPK